MVLWVEGPYVKSTTCQVYRRCDSGDKMFLVCHVALQDHMKKGRAAL